MQRGDAEETSLLFRELLAQYPQYANLWLAAPDGRLVASAQPVSLPIEDAELAVLREAQGARGFVQGP